MIFFPVPETFQLNILVEIFRAQETVERVDRQRVEAEEAATKAREKSRKLVEARSVDLAMEEGRRLGFEEGLKHGRVLSQMSESHDDSYSSSRRRSASRYGRRRKSKGGSSESLESDRSSLR
jgi:flagellar biosynthesis/type III secretory pathway protein FliH